MERTAAKIPNFVKNFNYFLKDSPDESIKSITSHLIKYFVKNFEKPVLIFTKERLTMAEVTKHFTDLNYNQRRLVTFQTCTTAESLLEKLLQIDVQQSSAIGTNVIPKMIIVESLHKWCDAIPLERIPRTYSTIVAATQDAINVLSHITNESCFSFVTSNLDEVPKIVVELFYGKSVDATLKDVEELLLKLHIK